MFWAIIFLWEAKCRNIADHYNCNIFYMILLFDLFLVCSYLFYLVHLTSLLLFVWHYHITTFNLSWINEFHITLKLKFFSLPNSVDTFFISLNIYFPSCVHWHGGQYLQWMVPDDIAGFQFGQMHLPEVLCHQHSWRR